MSVGVTMLFWRWLLAWKFRWWLLWLVEELLFI